MISSSTNSCATARVNSDNHRGKNKKKKRKRKETLIYDGKQRMHQMAMHSTRPIYLPTEIVVQIVRFIAAETSCRQSSLYTCCLISRQWYSVAVSFLYEKPQVGSGATFKLFADTIAPPIRARKSRVNLGSLVRRLDLSALVHHSSNSLTARLLGRVKENLEVFIAPKVSFS